MKLESGFKTHLRKRIESTFPGSMVLHLDPNEIQGIPDMLVLYGPKWATLEGKRYEEADRQPNQDYYVDKMDDMSFSAFIFPDNEDVVMNALYNFFISN